MMQMIQMIQMIQMAGSRWALNVDEQCVVYLCVMCYVLCFDVP